MCFLVDDTTENESLARSRSRRTKSDKSGKLAAFERLKNLRGSKNKYEVSKFSVRCKLHVIRYLDNFVSYFNMYVLLILNNRWLKSKMCMISLMKTLMLRLLMTG